MKRKISKSKLYLIFLTVTLLIFGIYSVLSSSQKENYTALINEFIPEVNQLKVIDRSPLTYRGIAKDNVSQDYTITFTKSVGYQSTIEVMTVIDQVGEIHSVYVVKQGETPAFFDKLTALKFTDKFRQLTIRQAIYTGNAEGYAGSSQDIITDNKVDAVSGATISSVAISRAVSEASTFIAKKYYHTNVINPYDSLTINKSELGMLAIYMVALLSVYKKTINKYRKWILIYSTLVVGFYINKFITFGSLYSFLNGNWPGLNNIIWYLLTFGTIGLIFISGKNLYCLWICPFGAGQEVILKFGGLKQIKLNRKLISIFRLIAPTTAYIALMIAFYTKEMHALAYDPFGAIFNLTALPIMWKILPILVFISLVQYRFYCTYFCPIGFILNLLTKFRNGGVKLWKLRRTKI